MEIGITRMSSKGQIVIPREMRKDFKPGSKIFVIKTNNQLVLKKEERLIENFNEDLEFAKRTEAALKRVEAGEYLSVDSENIEEEMMKW